MHMDSRVFSDSRKFSFDEFHPLVRKSLQLPRRAHKDVMDMSYIGRTTDF